MRLLRYSLIAAAATFLIGTSVLLERSDRFPTEDNFFAGLAFASCAVIAGCVLLVTRRAAFSLFFAGLLANGLAAASGTKFSYLQTKLLPHDFYAHLEVVQIQFFLAHYVHLIANAALLITAAFLALSIIWKFDRVRVHPALGAVIAIAGCATTELMARKVPYSTYAISSALNERYVSSFVLPARELSSILGRPWTLPSNAGDTGIAIPPTAAAQPAVRPHIIVVLHESSVDPSIYFEGDKYKVPGHFFASGDGQTRRLRVHAYGGGTWISEYGFLLGIDLIYFMDRSNVLGVIGSGAFQNTLPMELKALGYTPIANYPSPPTFLNTDKFYKSIGFDAIYSPKDMGLYITPMRSGRPRDRAYYEFLLGDIERRMLGGRVQPLFYFLWTTATHGPYRSPEFPAERTAEIASNDEVAEYARRQRFAADDLAWLENELASRFPGQQFVLVGFGDHHPYTTDVYYQTHRPAHVRPLDSAEDRYKTYYRIQGVNFAPAYENLPETAEIGFLGEIILQAARLPTGPSMAVRRWLREVCRGKWSDCADQSAVAAANRRLTNGDTSMFTGRLGESAR